MPQQKTFQADQTDPTALDALFNLAHDLAMDGWGVTIQANPQVAVMTTNAPMNIIEFHGSKQLV